jgi:hypothetical protein
LVTPEITDFIAACRDYYYLVNHRYPERGVLKLVGDRYRLSGDQRTILYRGISSDKRSEVRKALLVNEIAKHVLIIDGYNVLFTLLNYRLGRPVFLCTDAVLRDAGSLHGHIRDEKTFFECVDLLIDYLVKNQISRVEIYLDSPVSHSEKHTQFINEKMQERKLKGDCFVVKSADYALKHSNNSILATSDTVIIEKSGMPVVDLPRAILEQFYGAVLMKINELLAPDQPHHTVDKG